MLDFVFENGLADDADMDFGDAAVAVNEDGGGQTTDTICLVDVVGGIHEEGVGEAVTDSKFSDLGVGFALVNT